MAVPVSKNISQYYLISQLFIALGMVGIFNIIGLSKALELGIVLYLGLGIILKILLSPSQRKGMKLVKQRRFKQAIPHFEKSYEFFSRYSWLDKYRWLFLLSASGSSYKEVALTNIAFCYGQTMEGKKMIQYYQQALNEFPDSGMARYTLNIIEASQSA